MKIFDEDLSMKYRCLPADITAYLVLSELMVSSLP